MQRGQTVKRTGPFAYIFAIPRFHEFLRFACKINGRLNILASRAFSCLAFLRVFHKPGDPLHHFVDNPTFIAIVAHETLKAVLRGLRTVLEFLAGGHAFFNPLDGLADTPFHQVAIVADGILRAEFVTLAATDARIHINDGYSAVKGYGVAGTGFDADSTAGAAAFIDPWHGHRLLPGPGPCRGRILRPRPFHGPFLGPFQTLVRDREPLRASA